MPGDASGAKQAYPIKRSLGMETVNWQESKTLGTRPRMITLQLESRSTAIQLLFERFEVWNEQRSGSFDLPGQLA